MRIANNSSIKPGLRKKAALSLYSKYRQNETDLHELKYIFWECTLRCNLSCLHCGSDCSSLESFPDMPLRDFLNVLDEVREYVNPNKTMIALTGGEPTIRPDLADCGREFNKRGFPWGMVSNGYLLDRDMLGLLLDNGLGSITISLDGFDEQHDWLRGRKGSYSKALNAAELVASTKGLTYDIATCVHKNNISSLDDFYKMLIEKGIAYWRLFTIFPRGRAADNEILKPDKKLLIELFEFIKEKREEKLLHIAYGCEGYLGNYEGLVRDSFFFCRAGVNIGSVLIDGSISACPSIRNDFVQGNIYRDSFMDVWNKRYSLMRDRTWTKTGTCESCTSYNYCNGNGLHLRNEKNRELMFCHYMTMMS